MALYSKDAVGDLVLLETVDEQNILGTLKKRYSKDLIYTHIGNVLLSVNPFKEINGMYSEAQIGTYRGRYIYENPPHIFGLAEDTYRALCTDAEDQCVIISGESGAGKTEASKKIMQYIAAVTGSGPEIERVKNRILASNPVLEAFGNAKTQRNNNSSRFGKYMELFFDSVVCDPVGGRILNFLLEKSRVVGQLPDERSFHIFYMMLDGVTSQQRSQLQLLSSASEYSFLNKNQCYKVERMNDKEEWNECLQGMREMGMDSEVDDILRILSSILWLGQLEFVADGKDDKSKIVDERPIQVVSNLLGCDAKLLAQGMISRTYSANNNSVLTPLSIEQAGYTRDALAKTIYFRLFDFIVTRINEAIHTKGMPGVGAQSSSSSSSSSNKPKTKAVRTIGVLDIYGFEIFLSNSFEQFCINFVNEKLQQIFIEKTIKQEQEEYMAESIAWTPVQYFNNKIVCDLIESKKPAGIIAYLDEECLLGKSTDATFLDKLESNLKSHAHFERPKGLGKPSDEFTVKHYAGDVHYNVLNFLDKNRNLVWKDLLLIGESSSNRLMAHATMFPKGGAASSGLARPVTAGTSFKTQVQQLMDTLSLCQPHYIRCIKPNDMKKSGLFNDDMCMHQVRYLGLLENVRVRRAGFAFRQTYERFQLRYKMLSQATWPNSQHSPADACKAIMTALSISEQGGQYQMGKTKIFIRQPITLFTLEELRERKLHLLATLIQCVYRSYRTRKYFREQREKSLGLFGRNKLRRRLSVRRFYCGDYLNVSKNPTITKMLAKYHDQSAGGNTSNILFVDEVDKINRKGKTQRRIIMLTTHAVYNLGIGKFKENRRILIQDITKISVSPLADNYVVLHVPKEYDYLVVMERKTEFLTALSEEFKKLTQQNLQINFTPDITVQNKDKKSTQTLTVKKEGSTAGATHIIDPSNKDRICVSVGPIDVVTDAFLKSLEPVQMKRTDPALKPKPGYIARKAPVLTPGITVTSGASQQKASTYGQAANPQSPAASKELFARAVEDFTGADARELSFRRGDTLRVLNQDDSGWWSAELNGQLGYAPSTYLELIK